MPLPPTQASRRGLRLDHLFNARDGADGARSRLERDMKTYWGALKEMGVDEKQVLSRTPTPSTAPNTTPNPTPNLTRDPTPTPTPNLNP